MPTRAAIYCRISRDHRGDLLGVQRQEPPCRAFCAEQGWDVVEVYVDDSRSAYRQNVQRDAFERMLADAERTHVGFHPVYLALAIGCGSKPFMWMNDSGFWIIGKMSGFTEAETLKTASVMMAVMGVVGLGTVMLGAWLIPLV